MPRKSILVVGDGSGSGDRCLDAAISLARRERARLVVVLRMEPLSPLAVIGATWLTGSAAAFRHRPDRRVVLDRVPGDVPIHIVDAIDAVRLSAIARMAQELKCDTLVAPQSASSFARWDSRSLARRAGLDTVWVGGRNRVALPGFSRTGRSRRAAAIGQVGSFRSTVPGRSGTPER